MEEGLTCRKCGQTRPSNRFSRNLRTGGYRQPCKNCVNERNRLPDRRAAARDKMRAWRHENPALNWRRYIAQYHITPQRYDELLLAQGGVCAICGVADCPTGARLSVDHDHACCPGQRSCGRCVRGLLCRACNRGLGNYGDNPALLRQAADYVERTTAEIKYACGVCGFTFRTTRKHIEAATAGGQDMECPVRNCPGVMSVEEPTSKED